MAIIDLDSGKVDSAPAPQLGGGRIIDLDTGQFVEARPAPVQQTQPEAQQPEQETGGIVEAFTGSQRIEATPELGTLPEFGGTQEGDTPRIAAGLLSTFDSKAQQDIILSAIPDASFETSADGSTIIEVPTEDGGTRRSVLNRPGLSPQDLTTATAQVLSFVPAARLAGLGKTLLQKIGFGATAAGVTEQALQEGGVQLGRKERDPVGTAIAAATGGVAEAIVPAVQAFRAGKQAARVGSAAEEVQEVATSARAAQEATDKTGVQLFQGQQTGVPIQLEKQAFVAQLSAGSTEAVKRLKAQNQQASAAVEDFLGTIAPDAAVVTGPERIRTAAQTAIANAKQIRAEKASPIYDEAFELGADVDLLPVRELIADKLADLPATGEISKTLKRVNRLIKGEPSLKSLHNSKLEIDQIVKKVGEGSIGNTTKREVTKAGELLLNQIDDSSELYRDARQAFADASPPVDKITESIIGKVAELDDTQLKQVTSKLFDPAQTNPSVIRDAKKAIADVDPDAWQQIVRVELEKRLGSIKSTQEAGTVENIPGQLFRALFPNQKSTKVLMSALDSEGRKNVKYLETALGRARLGRPGGSQTASREEIKRELRGGIFQSFREFFKAPVSTLAGAGEDAAFNSRVSALAKMMYDPTWKAELKNIRKFSPASPAAGRAMTQLLDDILSSEEQ